VGVLVRMPAHFPIDLAGLAGMDAVLIDCEHGPGDGLALQEHIAAATAAGLHVLVRTGPEGAEIGRALDAGASGIVLPHVDSAADARRLVSAVRYPPAGNRGFATYTPVGGYGLADNATHAERMNRGIAAIAMIESRAALEAWDEICVVDGLDGVMVGPADLAHDVRAGGGTIDEASDVSRSARQTAPDSPLASIAIVNDEEAAHEAFAEGHALVLYNFAAAAASLLVAMAASRPNTR